MLGDDGEMGQAAIAKWGPQMAIPGGYIVQPGQDEYDHWFGGDRWRVIDPDSFCGGPTLLLTLDLSDPRLAALHAPGLPELPFGSYIDSSVWDKRQVYRVEPLDACPSPRASGGGLARSGSRGSPLPQSASGNTVSAPTDEPVGLADR